MTLETKLERILELGKKMDKAGVRLYGATHMPGKSDEKTVRKLDRCLLLWLQFNRIAESIKAKQIKKIVYRRMRVERIPGLSNRQIRANHRKLRSMGA